MLTLLLLLLLTGVAALLTDSPVNHPTYFPKIFILSFASLLAVSIFSLSINEHISPVASVLELLGIILTLSVLLWKSVNLSSTGHAKSKDKLKATFRRAYQHITISDSSMVSSSHGLPSIRILSLLYLALLAIISCFMQPVNGDSQVYNLSRVLVSLLSKSTFLQESSIPTQAFHSFAHDYLYTPDLLIGSTLGLGTLSMLELVYVWILVDVVISHSVSSCPSIFTKVDLWRARYIGRILLISMPPLFYQATLTKNDLVLAPLSISIALCLYFFTQEARPTGKPQLIGILTSVLQLFCGILLLYSSKGYGVVLLLTLFIVFLFTPFLARSGNAYVRKAFYSISNQPSGTANPQVLCILAGLVSIISTTIYSFMDNRQRYWADAYSAFTAKHSISSLESLYSLPHNLARIFLEFLINIPLPFRVSPGDILWSYRDKSFLPLTDTYSFGGVINEDISWPGVIFNLAAMASILLVLFSSTFSIGKSRRCSNDKICIPDLPVALGASGLISGFLLAGLLYWQPYSSRFFVASSILLVPLFAFSITWIIRLFPPRLARIMATTLMLTALLSVALPIAKQYYVLFRQVSTPDYYLLKSMNTSNSDLDSIVMSLSKPSTTICSRNEYSASLELLKRLRIFSLTNPEHKFYFPTLSLCDQTIYSLPLRSPEVLFFGGGEAPSIETPVYNN